MLSDRIGAKVRGSQDAPPLSMAEKLLFAFCAAALVFVCVGIWLVNKAPAKKEAP